MVVAASGPSAGQFPVGRKLDDAARIKLQSGDSVTVLDARGTKVIRGPGNFAVSQPGRPLPNPSFAVFTRPAGARARAGAVRTGEDGKPMSPNLWWVDIASPGTKCLPAPEPIAFWRADPKPAARYRIAAPGGAAGSLSFSAGADSAAWDTAKLPVASGSSYALSNEGGSPVGTFTFIVLQKPPPEAEALAALLIAKGCLQQLDLMAKSLSVARF